MHEKGSTHKKRILASKIFPRNSSTEECIEINCSNVSGDLLMLYVILWVGVLFAFLA